MFERPNTIPDTLSGYPDPHPEAVALEAYDRDRTGKATFRKKFAQKAIALTVAASTVIGAYWNNVEENRAKENAAEISLNVIAPAHDKANSHKVTFVDDGFNAYDADYLAGNMGQAIQQVADGELVSLGYNNALLSRDAIYEAMVNFVNENGFTSASVVGYSMGGVIGTEAVADIVKNSSLPINYLILVSTPDGSKGVRPYQKGELDFMQWLSETIPGAIDSSWFRLAGDVYFYKDRYTQWDNDDWSNIPEDLNIITKNVSGFMDAVGDAIDQANNPRSTSMRLISEQAYKVDTFNMADELNTISSQRSEKQLPVILYLGTGEPGYDTVVNDKLSSSNFAEDASNAGLFFQSYLVPGAVHSHYYDTPDEYMNTFYEASGPMAEGLKAEAGRHALNLFAQNFLKKQTIDIQAQK